jgi:hypothetical protein
MLSMIGHVLQVVVLVIVSAFFCLLALIHLSWAAIQTTAHLRAVGWRSLSGIVIMLRVQLRRPAGIVGVLSPLASLAIASGLVAWSLKARTLAAVPLALALFILFAAMTIKTLIRPYAVFLSSSSDDSAALQKEIKTCLTPLRVVSLLEARSDSEGGPVDVAIGADILRTKPGQDWRASVHDLAVLSDLIIMDLRHPSENIAHEAEYVLQPGLAKKTLFICNDDGSCPALTATQAAESIADRAFRVDQLKSEMLKRNPLFLDPARLAAAISKVEHQRQAK